MSTRTRRTTVREATSSSSSATRPTATGGEAEPGAARRPEQAASSSLRHRPETWLTNVEQRGDDGRRGHRHDPRHRATQTSRRSSRDLEASQQTAGAAAPSRLGAARSASAVRTRSTRLDRRLLGRPTTTSSAKARPLLGDRAARSAALLVRVDGATLNFSISLGAVNQPQTIRRRPNAKPISMTCSTRSAREPAARRPRGFGIPGRAAARIPDLGGGTSAVAVAAAAAARATPISTASRAPTARARSPNCANETSSAAEPGGAPG